MIIRESVAKRVQDLIATQTNNKPCWEYTTSTSMDGYGCIQSYLNGKKKHYRVHRVAYQLFYNDNLLTTDIICHKCDNPKCYNPHHLFKGTHKDNSNDKCTKERQAKGCKNGRYIDGRCSRCKIKVYNVNRKLPKHTAITIKTLLRNSNYTCKEIANLLDVSYYTVNDIKLGKVYNNI